MIQMLPAVYSPTGFCSTFHLTVGGCQNLFQLSLSYPAVPCKARIALAESAMVVLAHRRDDLTYIGLLFTP
jgi:hypothetical protein